MKTWKTGCYKMAPCACRFVALVIAAYSKFLAVHQLVIKIKILRREDQDQGPHHLVSKFLLPR